MRKDYMSFGMICAFISAMTFVSADLVTGPMDVAIPIIGIIIVIGFLIGSIFLIRWIIRKMKNKQ